MSFDGHQKLKGAALKMSQSLWNRAMSFDLFDLQLSYFSIVSIPLEQGNVFRLGCSVLTYNLHRSQSLWNRAMSFDKEIMRDSDRLTTSQSLWNRAMSFDSRNIKTFARVRCLNPFGTGQCLSTNLIKRAEEINIGLNPFGTGQCLSTSNLWYNVVLLQRLNPFGTGQCLST